ncbi:hypothetical protein XaraCFBP7407_19415 [Xanthomonas arboricola pv. arracaciae]|nr:hypothetical protein XaraCFBP7407_19415 [Xanthomonas arboricola pv. arracaciae]
MADSKMVLIKKMDKFHSHGGCRRMSLGASTRMSTNLLMDRKFSVRAEFLKTTTSFRKTSSEAQRSRQKSWQLPYIWEG